MFKSLYDDILEEGYEKGIEKGIEKGRQEGRLEGRMEEQKATAEKCLKLGLSIAEVVAITSPAVEEIKEIAGRMKK